MQKIYITQGSMQWTNTFGPILCSIAPFKNKTKNNSVFS